MVPRLKERYKSEIVPKLMEELGYKNVYQVPKVEKVIVNVGLGEASQDKEKKIIQSVVDGVAKITGQRPAITKAKKAIAGFKIRKGSIVGCKVTLRKARMYEFLDRLINVALPRIRDFRGLSTGSFDGHGNYSFGISEQGIFPEIEIDKVQVAHGMDIIIVTTAKNRAEGLKLLAHFGMPFKR